MPSSAHLQLKEKPAVKKQNASNGPTSRSSECLEGFWEELQVCRAQGGLCSREKPTELGICVGPGQTEGPNAPGPNLRIWKMQTDTRAGSCVKKSQFSS